MVLREPTLGLDVSTLAAFYFLPSKAIFEGGLTVKIGPFRDAVVNFNLGPETDQPSPKDNGTDLNRESVLALGTCGRGRLLEVHRAQSVTWQLTLRR